MPPLRPVGGGWGIVARRALADRLVLAAAFLVVLLAATLVAAIPIYADAVAGGGLHERLARAPVTERNLQVSLDVQGADRAAPLDARVAAALRDTFPSPPPVARSGISGPFADGGRIVVLGFYDALDRHARLTSGRWPGDAGAGAPAPVAVSAGAARALGLRVGDALTLRSRLDAARTVAVRISGVYRVADPAAAYWWNDPLETTGAGDGEFGPLVATRKTFFALRLDGSELRWRAEPRLGGLRLAQLPALRQALASLPARLNAGRGSGDRFAVDTGLGDILAGAARSLHVARAGLLVPSLQLALLSAYGLLFTAGLLLERRLLATESLRLRGASAGQIVVFALMEAALLAVPAAVAAPWLAALSLRALGRVGPLADVGLGLDPQVGAAAYGLAFAAAAACVAGLALPALRARRFAVAADRRRSPLAGLAQRARLDLVLVVLAAIGYWQLRRYRAPLVETSGGVAIDPFLIAAPAILLLAGALLSLRLVPLAARAAERLAAGSRGIAGALASRQLARRSRGYARSALLLVLAVAIGVFAAAYARTWHGSQVDQARYAAGADVLVQPSEAEGTPPQVDLASSYRTLGADEALPRATDSFQLSSETTGTLLAVDAARAASVLHVRSDFAGRPLRELLRPLADARGRLAGLDLPGRPHRLALVASVKLAPLPPPTRVPGTPFFGFRPPAPPSLFAVLADRDGLLYVYRLAGLRPDGRPHRLVVPLAHALGGDTILPRYPLRLVALDLSTGVSGGASLPGTLALHGVSVAGAGGSWRPVALAGTPWRGTTTGLVGAYRAPATGKPRVDGGVALPFRTGQVGPVAGQTPYTDFFLRPGRDRMPAALPVLASDDFLVAAGARVGQTVRVSFSQASLPVRIAGSFRRFPTLDPDAPALVADLPTWSALSFRAAAAAVQPDAWWLRLGPDGDSAAARLAAAPWSSLQVVALAERQRSLLDDPVAVGVVGALALGFVVAAAFAAVGFAVSAAASARTRTVEFAVLRALGLETRQLSAWVLLEHALMVVFSLAGGTALGLAVAWLVLPYVSLGVSGAAPVPPAQVHVPWRTVLWLELGMLAALVAVAAAQVRLVVGLRPAPALRSGEAA